VQVPTKDGWVFINPYSMLVTAYERLLGARGIELKDEPPTPPRQNQAAEEPESSFVGQKLAAAQPTTRIDSEIHVRTLRHGPRTHETSHARNAHCGKKC
jgi:hypothetical protein